MSQADMALHPEQAPHKPEVHPVDEKLPAGKLTILGLQHVLVMYAGAVAVPLVIGGSLGLPKDQISYLISSDLFCCGIVTLLQCLGIGRFAGIRLPVIMSVTFAAVMPMLAIGTNPALGLTGIFGATIAAGIQRWNGISAALPIPNMYSASRTATAGPSTLPARIPPGVKSKVPAIHPVQTMASSSKPIDVPSRIPRYRRPARMASGVPL